MALPAVVRTREQLEWVAEPVTDAGGEASLGVGRAGSKRQDREQPSRMATEIAQAYRAVIVEATEAQERGDGSATRTLPRLRRELRRIGQRDFFPPPQRDLARVAVEALAATLVGVGG